MKIKTTFFLVISMFLGINLYSQTTVTIESPAYLNEAILGDTAADGSHAATTYVLERDGTYYVRGEFQNINFKLHLVAAEGEGAMPIVKAALSQAGTQNWYMIGGQQDIEMEGIFFDAQSDNEGFGPANWCVLFFGTNGNITFNNCVFANAGQGGVGAWSAVNEYTVTNCKFYNMGNIEFNDQGTGRMIECRDSQVNKLTVKHNTLVNCYDRIVRHRNGSGVIKEMDFSHNTIVNHGGYFGFMELGNVGNSITIKDNLIIDAMSWGADTSDNERITEFNMHGETYPDGNNKITWVGAIPNDTTIYTIDNNINVISSELATFYSDYDVDQGPFLTDTIASRLSNPDNAFISQSVSLVEIPNPMIELVTWYYDNGKPKGVTTAADYNKMTNDYMLNTLDCSFTVSDELLGTDGIAVGDSNWFTEGETGISQTVASSVEFTNYPNPFSESTTLQFNLVKGSNVTINVCDITGRSVNYIDAGSFNSGVNTYVLTKGNLVPGIYFLKIEAGTQIGVRKIVVN